METQNLGLTIIDDTSMLFTKFLEIINTNFETIDEIIGSIKTTLTLINGE